MNDAANYNTGTDGTLTRTHTGLWLWISFPGAGAHALIGNKRKVYFSSSVWTVSLLLSAYIVFYTELYYICILSMLMKTKIPNTQLLWARLLALTAAVFLTQILRFPPFRLLFTFRTCPISKSNFQPDPFIPETLKQSVNTSITYPKAGVGN